jgi:hypothetical protein
MRVTRPETEKAARGSILPSLDPNADEAARPTTVCTVNENVPLWPPVPATLPSKVVVPPPFAMLIVTASVPVLPWYVAVIVAVPDATADTIPPLETVAMLVFELCHAAEVVTFSVVWSDNVAVAVS